MTVRNIRSSNDVMQIIFTSTINASQFSYQLSTVVRYSYVDYWLCYTFCWSLPENILSIAQISVSLP